MRLVYLFVSPIEGLYVQKYNAPLLALFQGSLHRIQVTLNDLDLSRIRNTDTVFLCFFCPFLENM